MCVGIGSLFYIINLLITPVSNVLIRLGCQGKGTEDFSRQWLFSNLETVIPLSYLCLVTHSYSDKLVLRRIQYLLWNRLLFIVLVGWYNKFVLLSHDKVPWCGTQRFDCLLQVFFRRWGRLVVHGIIYHGGLLWLVHFDPAIVSVYHGFLRRSLVFRVSLVLMFSYCRHPRFRYFGSVALFMLFWLSLM